DAGPGDARRHRGADRRGPSGRLRPGEHGATVAVVPGHRRRPAGRAADREDRGAGAAGRRTAVRRGPHTRRRGTRPHRASASAGRAARDHRGLWATVRQPAAADLRRRPGGAAGARRAARATGGRPMTRRAATTPSDRRPHVERRISTRHEPDRIDVDAMLADRRTRIIVCCGAGGVGKTTTAAALALRAAEQGRTVCVLTIDPARRLAQSLGLVELDNTPRPVQGIDAGAGGSLDAMMLDMKSTFDEVVIAHASPEKAAEILANPFYVALSSSFAGTQEYMAMEKLGQLHAEGRWDLIVVDTPPSRSALDFLDAPERLSSLLDGRFIKLLLAPAKGPARLFSAGLGIVTAALNKVLGAQVLRDMQTFVAAFDTLFGGSGSGPRRRSPSCRPRGPRSSWWRCLSRRRCGRPPTSSSASRPTTCRWRG